MKKATTISVFLFCFITGLVLLVPTNVLAQTQLSGNAIGIWAKTNSPYKVIGHITIPSNQVLEIQPGFGNSNSLPNPDGTIADRGAYYFNQDTNCIPPGSNLIAWWPFDENAGSVATDIAGANNGSTVNNPVFISGKVKNSVQFNGSNYVTIPDNDLLTFGLSDFTIEFWVNFKTVGGGSIGTPGNVFISHNEGAGTRNKWFFALGGGNLFFHINGPQIGPKFFPLVPFSPVTGRWYHLAVTRNVNTYTIYIDGSPQGSATVSDALPNPNAPLVIGQSNEGFGGFINGSIDEMTIYRRALSSAELSSIVNADLAGKCKNLAYSISDVGVIELNLPKSNCGLSSNEVVKVRVKNYGITTAASFSINYKINNNTTVTEDVNAFSLLPDSTREYTFTTKANLSAVGSYTIKAFTSLSGDAVRNNDTLTSTVTNSPIVVKAVLSAPVNNALNIPVTNINLTWSAATNATHYDLYLWKSDEPQPSSPVSANLIATSFTYTGSLSEGIVYNWKVVAKNLCSSATSDTFRFTAVVPTIVKDIGVVELAAPTSGCNLSANESIKVKLKNYGNTAQSGFTVSYRINNGAVVAENVGTLTVPPDSNREYTFTTKADLSAINGFNIKSFTSLTGDIAPTNDTASKTVQHFSGLGAPGNLLPLNGATGIDKPIAFSWSPVNNATAYDLYIWKATDPVPSSPVVSGLAQINYSYAASAFAYGLLYNWKVVARNNDCNTASATQSFTLRNLPDLVVSQITAPSTATSESDITVSWQITNGGTGSTLSARWRESVYLTETPATPSSGIFIGSFDNFSALNASQSYTYPAYTYRIPQGVKGTFYFVIATDYGNNIPELTDTNNFRISAPVTIALAPPPDLQVTALVVSPTNLFSEDTLNLSWTVKNLDVGPTRTTSWADAVYLSQSQTLNTANATLLGSFTRNGALNTNEQYVVNTKIKLPGKIEGTYYVHVYTDVNNVVYENIKEGNNSRVSSALTVVLRAGPNLTVSALSVAGDTVSNNQNLSVQWTARNEGATAANPVWYDNIRLTNDTVYASPQVYSLGNYAHTAALQSVSATGAQQTVKMPSALAEGRYYFFAKADVNDDIFEPHAESDNVSGRAGPVYVVNPDLKPLSIQSPAAAKSEESITVSWTVSNIGKGGVYNYSWEDKVYLSSDTVLNGNDILLATVSNSLYLGRQDQYVKQQEVTLPVGIQGTWYLIVNTDAGNKVFEKTETNNQLRAAITVTLSPWPDLQVISVTGPSVDTAGTNLHFSYTVKNSGISNIVNRSWTDKLYLSPTNSLNDPYNILLKSLGQQRSLDTTGTYTVDDNAVLPSNISGTYYLLAVTDADNAIFENTGEANNRKLSTAISIAPLPHADLAAVTAKVNANALVAGGTVTIEYTGKNLGPISTIANPWEDGVYLSNNPVLDGGDLLLTSPSISTVLTPNGTYIQTRSFSLPNNVSGNLYLLLNVDRDNRHNDINRANNTITVNKADGTSGPIQVTLPPPSDLLPLSVQSPAEGIAGQPFDLIYTVKNNGTGSTNNNSWMDKVYLSSDYQLGSGDVLIGSFTHDGGLAAGSQYTDTQQVFLPVNLSGNYILIFKTDANDNVYEHEGEDNNLGFASIYITPQLPSDLLVTQVVQPSGTQIAGTPVTVAWSLKNAGANPAKGFLRDAVYLSQDTVWDAADVLLGIKDSTLNLPPQSVINRQLTKQLSNVATGNYYVIVRTDILNNVLEANETNNARASDSAMAVDVKLLTMAVAATDTLINNQPLYYRINITAAQKGETMLLTLNGDSAGKAINKLYLAYNKVPAANGYDFASEIPFKARQEITAPELQEGTYYLMALGSHPSAPRQTVSLLAQIIPFSITKVEAAKGGNTGFVTVKLSGARFEPGMTVKLSGASEIAAQKLSLLNSTAAYVTFNLAGKSLGLYTVKAVNGAGTVAQLVDGFEIVTGSPGSADGSGGGGSNPPPGFTCSVQNIGYENNLTVGTEQPSSARPNATFVITVSWENTGNVDLPIQHLMFVSTDKKPISFTTDFSERLTELLLECREAGGPPDVIRPGASGFFKIYALAEGNFHEVLHYVIQ